MSEDSLIAYPCDFPIKVMGARSDDFAQTVVEIVLRHDPDFQAETVEMRASSSGTYLSLTCTIRATSREQLDSLYQALSSHPLVKIVL